MGTLEHIDFALLFSCITKKLVVHQIVTQRNYIKGEREKKWVSLSSHGNTCKSSLSPINPRVNRWDYGGGARGGPLWPRRSPSLKGTSCPHWMRGDWVEHVEGYRILCADNMCGHWPAPPGLSIDKWMNRFIGLVLMKGYWWGPVGVQQTEEVGERCPNTKNHHKEILP